MTQEEINIRFTYHASTPEQIEKMKIIREESKKLVELLVANTPVSAELVRAINNIEEATMLANAAIVRRS